jgi:ligand-binding SRPBCC domain-containing protein
MNFSILTPSPIQIQQGTILDYQIRVMGIPLHWRSQIIDWSPKRQFIDLQLRGPYALWHHQHTFTPGDHGTICSDRVIYKVPIPIIGRVMNSLLVRRQLMEIFQYRRTIISKELGFSAAGPGEVMIKKIG